MTTQDRRFKQRLIGAIVLVVLGVIFLPMLFDREAGSREVRVEAPQPPAAPAMRPLGEPPAVAAVAVPERQAAEVTPQDPPDARLDDDYLPTTWAILVAQLPQGEALALQNQLRGKGHDAYVRLESGVYTVYIGPLVSLEDCDRLLDRLSRDGLNAKLVRFEPLPR